MVYKPVPCRTRWEGLLIAFWIVVIDLLLLIWMGRRSIDWIKFVLVFAGVGSLLLLVYVLYRTWAAFSIEYWVDRNAITLSWANTKQVIPLRMVRRIIQGGLPNLGPGDALRWPAPFLGRAITVGMKQVQMVATQPLEQCLLLDTGEAVFAVSPQNAAAFLDGVQARYRLGPVAKVELTRVRSSLWDRIFGGERLGPALLGAGLAGALLLFGILMVRFPNLPDALAFHYNSDGLPDVIREKSALFLLPAVGFLAWAINGLWGGWMAFHQQRIGAYMLWAGALLVQICSYLALTSLMN
ncbi:MAG: DUF1648 domain-containing protein [Caldilineaceae bacterium]|nr:DUF1648 domain-containing protein [Caldilineaceae bacterium]